MLLHVAIFLAVIQGVAEFLPISSSGHLRIFEALLGFETSQTLFDLILHLGTLTAVIWVYRELLGRMTVATLTALSRPAKIADSYRNSEDFRVFVLVCLAMVPTGVIALVAGKSFEGWAAAVAFVGGALLVNAGMLFFLGRFLARRSAAGPSAAGLTLAEMTWKHALVIGTVQGIAVIRGISRSGSTITTGVVVGLRQDAAAAFSFLLSIPAVLGAFVLTLGEFDGDTSLLLPGLLGAVVACLVGVLALRFLLKMLGSGRLDLFAGWCAAVGTLAIVWDLTR